MRNGPHRILKSREENSMANCKNCGAEISPLAKVCPYCGMPQQVQEEDPFDQTQAYIPNQGQPSGGNYNSQPAGNGYGNQSAGGYNNQPVSNYNNQPVNNYNNQPMGNGYNMNGGPGYGMEQRPAPMPTGGMIALSIVAILFCTICFCKEVGHRLYRNRYCTVRPGLHRSDGTGRRVLRLNRRPSGIFSLHEQRFKIRWQGCQRDPRKDIRRGPHVLMQPAEESVEDAADMIVKVNF